MELRLANDTLAGMSTLILRGPEQQPQRLVDRFGIGEGFSYVGGQTHNDITWNFSTGTTRNNSHGAEIVLLAHLHRG